MADALRTIATIKVSEKGMREAALQDNLPSEVLRELQVEELWARRTVLADFMNRERFSLYLARHADAHPETFAQCLSAVS